MTLLKTLNYKIERLNKNTIRITSKDKKVMQMSMTDFEDIIDVLYAVRFDTYVEFESEKFN